MRKTLSTSQVAALIGVAVASVSKWIDQGSLRAGRTPGGHRRVTPENLVAFLKKQQLPIPEGLEQGPTRVLLVDDDEAVTLWLAEEIAAAHPDWEVREARDGFTAGDLINSWRPNAVILDLVMPGMDGREVCRSIKARSDLQNIVVIAITGHDTPQAKEQILAAGAQEYFTKPLNSAALLKTLEATVA